MSTSMSTSRRRSSFVSRCRHRHPMSTLRRRQSMSSLTPDRFDIDRRHGVDFDVDISSSFDIDRRHGGVVDFDVDISSSFDIDRRHGWRWRLVDFDVDIFYSVVWYVAVGKQGRTSMMSLAYGALETTSQYNFSIICLSNGYIWLLSLSTWLLLMVVGVDFVVVQGIMWAFTSVSAIVCKTMGFALQ